MDLGRGSSEAHAVDGGEHRRGRARAEADSDVRGVGGSHVGPVGIICWG